MNENNGKREVAFLARLTGWCLIISLIGLILGIFLETANSHSSIIEFLVKVQAS